MRRTIKEENNVTQGTWTHRHIDARRHRCEHHGAQAAVSEAEALNTAISFTRVVGRKSGALQISSPGASTFVRAEAAFNGAEGGAPELVEGAQAISYAFVLKGNGMFQPNEPHPRGQEGPSGKYLGLIVDAKVNKVDGEYLGPTPPNIGELGTVVTINLTGGEAEAAATSCRAEQLLTAALARKHLGARHHSAALALRMCIARR